MPARVPEPGEVCKKCGDVHWRDGRATCTAHQATRGGFCRSYPVPGLRVCRHHGGSGPQVAAKRDKAIAWQRVEGQVARLLKDYDVGNLHPLEGLLEVVRHTGTMTRALASLVAELDLNPGEEVMSMNEEGEVKYTKPTAIYGPNHLGDGAPHVVLEMYGHWLDRYAKACKLALEAGVAERQVRVMESQAELLASAIRGILGDLSLTSQQQEAAPAIVRRHLLQLPAGVAE